ncbi:MAG: hypothetical protein H0S85_04160 [Desulfovibrionaceae bacterium]|jgi:hypothetical protein|nr:hypothetical protein [Desulfovibrionaceae bacterium]
MTRTFARPMARVLRRAPLAALLAALFAVALLASGCAKPPVYTKPLDTQRSLGLAGFTQPLYTWQLLAGYIPDNRALVEDETLFDLDRTLAAQLLKGSKRPLSGPAVTRQCQEIVVFENKDKRGAALDYWTNVGRCMPVDYLVVPQVVDWREREGSERGVTRPASVVLDLYVIDVAKGELVSRYHFDETQTSLSENLLDFNKFLSRKARWLTAEELAQEGIRQGLLELGL